MASLLYRATNQGWKMRYVLGRECRSSMESIKRNNQMKYHLYLGKFIKTPGDLAPKGVRSTYQNEKLSFNETFEKIWEQINIKK